MPDVVVDQAVLDLLGYRPITEGGGLFCGVSEEPFAINGVTYQWPRGAKLSWGIGFSRLGGLSDMDCKDAVTEALKEISSCCDVSHSYNSRMDSCNLWIVSQRLDGKSGVLGDCQIPQQNANPNNTQLKLRCDDSEIWGMYENPPNGSIDFYRFVLHELLHGHGLGHKPMNIAERALIEPLYSLQMRHLQAADKAELVRRYGVPQSIPTTPDPGMPDPNSGVWVFIPGGRAQTLKPA